MSAAAVSASWTDRTGSCGVCASCGRAAAVSAALAWPSWAPPRAAASASVRISRARPLSGRALRPAGKSNARLRSPAPMLARVGASASSQTPSSFETQICAGALVSSSAAPGRPMRLAEANSARPGAMRYAAESAMSFGGFPWPASVQSSPWRTSAPSPLPRGIRLVASSSASRAVERSRLTKFNDSPGSSEADFIC
ncbi:MAG: hypothetical protein BWZ10_00355 [candidate division BRC1 bacterium ADurb.BinA364]|nr:MAG: hypothetical protein BWZ10_00355 [candidate division BRC1 bacterium ADurb.BinA364]